MATKEEKMEAFGHLLDILDELRVKCPWDRKQTNESLRTNTIEETYELCDAIMKNDNANIKKECVIIGTGDRLEIWSEENWNKFYNTNKEDLSDIAENLFDSNWVDGD